LEPTLIGSTIGGYQIIDVIGRGGMGIVYKAHDPQLDRYAAVKMMEKGLANSESFQKRFRSEARALARVKHPNIVDVYAFHETDFGFCIMMEYCEGNTLAEIMQPGVPLDVARSLHLIDQVAGALEHAHEAGVIHRDIKPTNIIVQSGDTVKVMDFGLAKLRDTTALTQTLTSAGSPGYMSPEQVKGVEPDHRADIWAVGVVLYEVLTGRRPFWGDNPATLAYLILNTTPIPIRQLNPLVPQEVEECVSRCLQKDPAERYQSIGEFRADIARILGTRERGEGTGQAKARRRRDFLKIALPLAGIALVAFLAYFLFLRSSPTEINITSGPSGGLVSLDGVDIGATPIRRNLSSRQVLIRITRPGYVTCESLVVVPPGSSSTLFFVLQQELQEELPLVAQPAPESQRRAVSPPPPDRAIAGGDHPVVAPVEETTGRLQVGLSTNKGQNNLQFAEGDTIRLFVRVNRPAYIRVIYNVADGKRILLTGPRDLRLSDQKSGVDVLLGEFVCSPPFGSESIQALASGEAFVPPRTSMEGGLCYLNETQETAAPLTRGIQSIPKQASRAEARLLLTTVARGVPRKESTP
jgi:serine/threonine protein kinase